VGAGVGEQVEEDLLQPPPVAVHPDRRHSEVKADRVAGGERLRGLRHLRDQRDEIQRGAVKRQLRALQARRVCQVAHQRHQRLRLVQRPRRIEARAFITARAE